MTSQDSNKAFSGKTFLITGGTGSFGNVMANFLLSLDVKEIRILSRDESKQDLMRRTINDQRISFYIGDVRDKSSLDRAFSEVDFVFHAAALKHVPSSEFFPIEAVKTNILGTDNVLRSSIENNIKKVVLLSTDKAVQPVNIMGMSKGIMEGVGLSFSRLDNSKTKICITRYGNVIASRGSVIPHFIRQGKAGNPLTVTDPNMTRFVMSLSDAVDLVLFAFNHGESGDIFVQKSPSVTVQQIAEVTNKILNRPENEIKTIGTRHGEKMYETLVSNEELRKSIDLDKFYRIPIDGRTLNYDDYVSKGDQAIEYLGEYNSDNTERLSNEELYNVLIENTEIQKILEN